MSESEGLPPTRLSIQRATASLLDVVEELAQGLANGQTPERGWADVVTETFARHRADLAGEPVNWDEIDGVAER